MPGFLDSLKNIEWSRTGQLMPDLGDKRTWRNVALASVPIGSLSFLVSKMLNRSKARKEAQQFEQQVREFVQSENPVISLDPTLADEPEEEAARNLGLSLESRVPDAARNAVTRVKELASKLVGKKADGGLPRFGGGRNPDVGAASPITGDLEPGILLALAWLSATYGWNKARKTEAAGRLELEKARTKQLENRLEQSEYNRLYQANDPEGFSASLAKGASGEFAPSSIIDALLKSASPEPDPAVVAWVMHRARNDGAPSSDPVPAPEYREPWLSYIGRKMQEGMTGFVNTGEYAYPSLFAALLLGSYGIGKHFANKSDRNRQRQKTLKAILGQEMLGNQTPAVLDVGSELPWEKAKNMPAAQAMDPGTDLPEAAAASRLRERREIRI